MCNGVDAFVDKGMIAKKGEKEVNFRGSEGAIRKGQLRKTYYLLVALDIDSL